MLKRFLVIPLLLVAMAQSLCAQHIFMRRISPDNGISAHEIYNIFQDSRHFIWFGTDAGVWRFDGKEYKSFTTENGLTDNVVFGFFEDSKKRLWLNSYNNKISYIENDKVFTIPCSSWLFQHLGKELIGSIYVDATDTLYISYWNKEEILKIAPPYHESDIHIIPVHADNTAFIYLLNDTAALIGSHLNIRKSSSGLTLTRKGKETTVPFRDIPQRNPRINLVRQKDGSFLAGISNILFHLDHGKVRKLHTFNHVILHSIFDDQKNLWVATIDGGLQFYKNSDTAFAHPQVYFRNDFANCIIQDNEGSFWIATLKNGLYYLPFSDLELMNGSNGLTDNISYSCYEPAEKTLYCFGTDGVLYTVRNDSVLKKIDITLKPNEKNNIYTVIPLSSHEWLCIGRQCFRLDTKSGKISIVRYKDPALKNSVFPSTNACMINEKVYCSVHGSIFEYHVPGNSITSRADLDFKINAMFGLDKNSLLLATERGLFRLDLLSKKIFPVPTFSYESAVIAINALPGTTRLVVILKSGSVFIMEKDLGKIVKVRNNLGGISVRNSYVDGNRNIWLSTNKGILKLDENLGLSVIDKAHGLPTDLVYQVCSNGKNIFVASERGLISFPSCKSFIDTTAPDLYITRVLINEREVPADSLVLLHHDQNFIKINWLGLDFRDGAGVTCHYRLNGLEKEWKITRLHVVEYTTLPPGDYEFEAYLENADNTGSEGTVHLHFTIHPPFWKTWWFITLLATCSVLSLVLLQKYRERRIEKREREKAELTRKTVQAEMQALRSQMNPHFIFNSINSIQHHILTNDPLNANKYLTRFSKLIRNILEQSRKERISLADEIETLRLFIEMEALRFEEQFDYEITVEKSVDPRGTLVPPLIIQPFAENAIWHGLLLRKGDKKLLIHVTQENNILQIEIDDNGIGRQQASKYRNETLKKESLGMKITSERLELIENALRIKASVQVIDKYGTNGETAGTKVILLIPLN